MNLLLVFLLIFGFIMLSAILVIVFFLGRGTIKDNSKQGLVFVKTGSHVNKPIKAKLSEVTKKGISYMYGNKKIVMVPSSYQENYYRGKRLIFVSHLGQLIASPFDKDIPISDTEMESLIYELCASHIGSDSIRALQGKGTMNVIIVGIVAFVIGIMAMFAFQNFQSIIGQKQVTPPIPEQQQKVIPQEVK